MLGKQSLGDQGAHGDTKLKQNTEKRGTVKNNTREACEMRQPHASLFPALY